MRFKNCAVAVLFVFLFANIAAPGSLFPSINGVVVNAETISTGGYQVSNKIRLNSIGYFPDAPKKATIAASCTSFQLVTSAGEVVFSGTPTSMQDADSGEQVYIADFSTVTQIGSYILIVPGVGKSVTFKIATDVYNDAYKTSMLGMYLWRCGTEVSATYNGNTFSHATCHTQDASTKYINGQDVRKDSTKGWHDAGDYNKYVVNAGITVGPMFMAWEQFEDQIKSLQLTLPSSEKNNTLPDFLDEMKYETDWLLTMQYPDGSGKVSHKVSTLSFGDFSLPNLETTQRYFVPWSSAATADFVAMMAMAGRIFKPYDSEYAQKCIDAAKVSYNFLKNNPGNTAANQSGFSTGAYATTDQDDRLWAAAEMWETLGDADYLQDFETRANSRRLKIDLDFDWGDVGNLGMFTYLRSSRTGKNQSLYNSIKTELLSVANQLVTTANGHGYGRPMGGKYYWGCNGTVVRQTMILQLANQLEPKAAYINTSLDAVGHVFGRNYYGRSYVTGLGVNPPMNPHDRRSGGDNIRDPWPGYLVGGGHTAKGWVDNQDSYETNEIAINWNSALIYALAAFVKTGSTSVPTPTVSVEPTPSNNGVKGDVDGNGTLNSIDFAYVRQFLLGMIKTFPSSNGDKAADMDGNGSVNSIDFALMRQRLLGS